MALQMCVHGPTIQGQLHTCRTGVPDRECGTSINFHQYKAKFWLTISMQNRQTGTNLCGNWNEMRVDYLHLQLNHSACSRRHQNLCNCPYMYLVERTWTDRNNNILIRNNWPEQYIGRCPIVIIHGTRSRFWFAFWMRVSPELICNRCLLSTLTSKSAISQRHWFANCSKPYSKKK